MKVLIVEDELKIRTGMAKLIVSHTEHEVVGEAKNGKEALELVLRFHPHLIISDIRMPVMDGLELMEEIQRQGIHCHFVILSGYSEFEYAIKALRLGAEDYLLKPIAPEDVISLLEKVQKKIEKEETQQLETAESILKDLYLNRNEVQEDNLLRLKNAGHYDTEKGFWLLTGYLGNVGTDYALRIQEIFQQRKTDRSYGTINYVFVEQMQQVICLIQSGKNEKEMLDLWKKPFFRLLKEQEQPLWCMIQMNSLNEISLAEERIKNLQVYGLVLGYRRILTESVILEYTPERYDYPRFYEAELQSSLCSVTAEKLQDTAEGVIQYIRNCHWEPRYIRKTYRNLLHFVENVVQETSSDLYQSIEKMDVQKRIHESITLGELESTFCEFVDAVTAGRSKKDDIRNYTILRAINFIKEHYAENISLEQLSEQLEITPEYLSALFNREVGINFSVFLKQFRISHAKRLLKGTDLKIYEIAAMVGYRDPKYFNRVFKEEVGISPGDFR